MTDVRSPGQSGEDLLTAVEPGMTAEATARSLTYRAIAVYVIGFTALAGVAVGRTDNAHISG